MTEFMIAFIIWGFCTFVCPTIILLVSLHIFIKFLYNLVWHGYFKGKQEKDND